MYPFPLRSEEIEVQTGRTVQVYHQQIRQELSPGPVPFPLAHSP